MSFAGVAPILILILILIVLDDIIVKQQMAIVLSPRVEESKLKHKIHIQIQTRISSGNDGTGIVSKYK